MTAGRKRVVDRARGSRGVFSSQMIGGTRWPSTVLSALTPHSGLLGKDYAKDVDSVSGEHLHIRAAGRDEGLWRVSLDAVDAWTAGAAGEDDKGPFARLLNA
jgi:hypothetical protein